MPVIDALLEGRAVRFHRYELPPAHPLSAPAAGHPGELLMLGADDVVRPVEGFAPPGNRTQRRAAGWR